MLGPTIFAIVRSVQISLNGYFVLVVLSLSCKNINLYTRKQILPSDIAQTEQIVTEVNDRRLCGKPA